MKRSGQSRAESHAETLEALAIHAWQYYQSTDIKIDYFNSPSDFHVSTNDEENIALYNLAIVHSAIAELDPSTSHMHQWRQQAVNTLGIAARSRAVSNHMPDRIVSSQSERSVSYAKDILAEAQALLLVRNPDYHGPIQGEIFATAIAVGEISLLPMLRVVQGNSAASG